MIITQFWKQIVIWLHCRLESVCQVKPQFGRWLLNKWGSGEHLLTFMVPLLWSHGCPRKKHQTTGNDGVSDAGVSGLRNIIIYELIQKPKEYLSRVPYIKAVIVY